MPTPSIVRLRSLISIIHYSIEDVPVSPKKKADMMETINKAKNKIAYFPDGFRFCYHYFFKSKGFNATCRNPKHEVISPRALKHVQHLAGLVGEENTECMVLFIVQRSDCVIFQPSKTDPGIPVREITPSFISFCCSVFREAVYQASLAGVKIVAQTVIWDSDGQATWGGVLPSNLRDDDDQ